MDNAYVVNARIEKARRLGLAFNDQRTVPTVGELRAELKKERSTVRGTDAYEITVTATDPDYVEFHAVDLTVVRSYGSRAGVVVGLTNNDLLVLREAIDEYLSGG